MPLTRKLDDDEWDVLGIVTDPILLGEFLRNTADGSPIKEEWPKQKFGYRWYQKDLLSDKSEFISLVAGRAVGKCSPSSARIYVWPYGYMMIRDMIALSSSYYRGAPITAYCIDPKTQELVQRRMKITYNGQKTIYTVKTASGFEFQGTDNHPILTQRGYIEIKDLDENDKAAVVTFLPHESMKREFVWEELRWFGYAMGRHRVGGEMLFTLKFQSNVMEMKRIADYFDARFDRQANGQYQLFRKRGPLPHYATHLIDKVLNVRSASTDGFWRVPLIIKAECLDNIKTFLEAFLSQYAEFTTDSVTFTHEHKTFTRDIQELLLRFGVESVITVEDDMQRLTISDYTSYWKLFQSLTIPGVSVKNLRLPPQTKNPTDFMRFEDITNIIKEDGEPRTYAVTIHELENYLSDNVFVHNSLVLEDKIIFDAINVETAFPATKESTLVTANVSQMTPILDRLIMRLGNSSLLKDFLRGQINRSKGTLDFPQPGGTNYRINARIAGSKGEQNMVGLHTPKITGDEMQIFPMAAYTQLGP